MSDAIEIAFEGTRIAARAGESVAAALAAHGILSLRTTRDAAERGMFCDLLAQTPLNLERNVSVEKVREFKLTTRDGLGQIVPAVRAALPGLTEQDGVDLVAAATSMAGTFHQIATPGPEVAALYRSDPRLSHALVEVEPRLARILGAMLRGMLA